jgi:protein-disulfide isomerase
MIILRITLTFVITLWVCSPAVAQKLMPDAETVVVVIDGEEVKMKDLMEFSKRDDPRQIHLLNEQLADYFEHQAARMVENIAIDKEAKRQGTTLPEILNKLYASLPPITEEEILATFQEGPAGAQESGLETARPAIVRYLQNKQREAARKQYVAELVKRQQARVIIPRTQYDIPVASTDPVEGNGTITLVEYSDFECPYCKSSQPILKEVLAKYPGKVKHVWKDFPIPSHRFARLAAEAGKCANDQGKFWAYKDVLFDNQKALGAAELKKYAALSGLDSKTFDQCLNSGKYRKQIAASMIDNPLPINGTPTMFVNGRKIGFDGTAPKLHEAIQRELGVAAN